MISRTHWKLHASGFFLTTALLAGGMAWANGPSLSGPSMAKSSAMVPLSARSLPAGSAVTVAVTSPGGSEAHYSQVSGADGTLAVNVKAGGAGSYKVRLLDSGGRQIAATMFIVK